MTPIEAAKIWAANHANGPFDETARASLIAYGQDMKLPLPLNPTAITFQLLLDQIERLSLEYELMRQIARNLYFK